MHSIYYGYGRVDAGAAVLAAGDLSATTPVAADTTPPTVAIPSPSNNATVSGTVQISVVASDNVAVSRLECYVDNILLGTASGTTSLTCSWNTRKYSGPHTISARAVDTSNNTDTETIQVTVGSSTKSNGSSSHGKGGKWK